VLVAFEWKAGRMPAKLVVKQGLSATFFVSLLEITSISCKDV
jgi:hypothetical protein